MFEVVYLACLMNLASETNSTVSLNRIQSFQFFGLGTHWKKEAFNMTIKVLFQLYILYVICFAKRSPANHSSFQ